MKFRGKDIKTGEWVEGYYIEAQGRHFIVSLATVRGEYQPKEKVIAEILYQDEVHPDSISMSTGRRDKNDEEIFGSIEIDGKMTRGGDKVKCEPNNSREGCVGNVVYNNSTAAFYIDAPYASNNDWYLCRVIGRQYDEKE